MHWIEEEPVRGLMMVIVWLFVLWTGHYAIRRDAEARLEKMCLNLAGGSRAFAACIRRNVDQKATAIVDFDGHASSKGRTL